VLDLSLVAGVDMSSAEAFVRIHRLLAAKRVTLVFCGFTADSPIGKALRSVEVLGVRGVELFGTFNDAMECKYLLQLAIGKMTNIFWYARDGKRIPPCLVQVA